MPSERRRPKIPFTLKDGSPNLSSNPPAPLTGSRALTVTIRDSKQGDEVINQFLRRVQAIETGKKVRNRANYGPNTQPTREILNERLQEGFGRWIESFSHQLDVEISTEQFKWPVSSRVQPRDYESGFYNERFGAASRGGIQRRNGSVILSSPINIVDTGYFLKSKSMEVDLPALKATFSWNAPYAGYILLGTRYQPGRDWITPALDNTQPFRVFFGRRVGQDGNRFR